MGNWTPLDWIAYGGLGLTVFFSAANQAIIGFPAIRKSLPRRLRTPFWGFLPALCFIVATAAFVARELSFPSPPPKTASTDRVAATDFPAAPAPTKIELPPPTAILPTTAASASVSTPAQTAPAPIAVGSDNFSLMSNDALKKRAFELAQEILDFEFGFHQKETDILYGTIGYKLSPAEKADQVMALEIDASEKFKQQFATVYLPLQEELVKRSTAKEKTIKFGQASLDLVEIAGTAFSLQVLAKGVQ